MGVKLMLDGKPIGEMGADGEIKDAAGAVVKTEPVGDDDKNKLKIPLVTPFDQAAIAPVTKVPLEPEGGDKPPAKAEPDTELALKNRHYNSHFNSRVPRHKSLRILMVMLHSN